MANSGEEVKLTFCQKFGNGCSSFGTFLYNSETGKVMGRSGESWAKIGLFYLIFYGFLAGFFAAMLTVFLSTVNDPKDGGPKLTQFIKNKAGLTLVGNRDLLREFDSANNDIAKKFRNETKKLFDEFKDGDVYDGVCDKTKTEGIPKGSKPCFMDNAEYGPCSPDLSDTSFGFSDNKPCVFVKINKVYDWVPGVDGEYLELQCSTGVTDGIVGVHPKGFLVAAFPFRGVKGHNLPYVAIQLDASKLNKDSKVDCKLSGKDIEVSSSFNKARSYGVVRIEEVYAKK